MGTYGTAEVCPNGHVSTDAADRHPEQREKFCSKCGEATLIKCPSCSASVRGDYTVPGVVMVSMYEPPAYCYNCGKRFPWTERKVNAAVELLEADGNLSSEEVERFRTDLDALTKETPSTQVAAYRYKTLMGKVGSNVATGVREIVVDVLSEAAKKAIWG